MTNWTVIITAIGSIGWLLILREGLQRYAQRGLAKTTPPSEFQVNYCPKPLGRLQLVTLEWRDYTYCMAVDINGSYVQIIDKRPIQKASS
jgi:hypothetical protein